MHHIYSKLYVFAIPALETDDYGNVYLGASYYSDSMTIVGEMTFYKPVEHSSSIFLLKFNSSGQLLRQKQWFGGPGATCKSLDINPENNSTSMAGEFQFYCNYESFILNGDNGSSSFEPYILKLSDELIIDTAFSISGIGRRYVTDVNFSNTGNTFLSGYFQDGYMIIGEDTLINTSSKTDFFIISFDTALNPQWHQRSYGVDHERVTSLITDGFGNIFTSISFEGDSITLEDTTIIKNAVQISFILSLIEANGNYQWIKTPSFESSGIAADISLIDSNSIIVSGSFDGEYVSLGSVEIYNPDPNKSEAFLFKIEDGDAIHGYSFGGYGDQSAEIAHSNQNGDIVVMGSYFSDSLKVDDHVIYNKGNRDFYVLKVKPNPTSTSPAHQETISATIFPNPASKSFNIDIKSMEMKKVMIWDLNGKLLLHENCMSNIVDISNFNPGIYFVSIFRKDRKPIVQKLLIQ
jgi:hypothetical protein